MSALYLAADPIEAQILRDYLRDNGIAVRIDGEHLWSARGELPMEYPRLYLLDAADEPQARALLAEYERRANNPSTSAILSPGPTCGCISSSRPDSTRAGGAG